MDIPRIRLTLATRRILWTFLDHPDTDLYVAQVCAATDLPSGTVSPLLVRLARQGILTTRLEDIDPRTAGRPRRRYYRLTTDGAAIAEANLTRPATKETPQ